MNNVLFVFTVSVKASFQLLCFLFLLLLGFIFYFNAGNLYFFYVICSFVCNFIVFRVVFKDNHMLWLDFLLFFLCILSWHFGLALSSLIIMVMMVFKRETPTFPKCYRIIKKNIFILVLLKFYAKNFHYFQVLRKNFNKVLI